VTADGAPHDCSQLAGGDDRLFAARLDDRPGNPARVALFAKAIDRVGQLGFGRTRDEICRGLSARRIHSHVQRLVALEAEAAARSIELQRRDSEIRERSVDLLDAARAEYGVNRAVIGVHELDTIAKRRQTGARCGERMRIAVEAEHACGAGLEQRLRVAAEADGAVDEQAASFRAQERERLGREHGDVCDQIPNSDSARASSSV
jgi:hypothetical protein